LKYLLLFLFAILINSYNISSCFAQFKWPKIDKTFFQETNYAKYQMHTAVILNSEAVTHFVWNSNTFDIATTYKYRYKILKPNGYKFANIALNYISENDYERISDISGVVYNIEKGQLVAQKMGKSNIYKQKQNNKTELKMIMPNIRVGSIFEYSYTITKQSFSNINTFYFQEVLPVLHSVYSIYMPEYYTFNTKLIAPQSLKLNRKKHNETLSFQNEMKSYLVTQYTYELKNVPKFEFEPFQSSIKNEQFKIDFALLTYYFKEQTVDINTNWQEIGSQVSEHPYIGMQLDKKISFSFLNDSLSKSKSKKDSINTIIKKIKNEIKWNEIYDLYAVSLKEAINLKEGNSATLNLLLLNQLQKYDIASFPVLSATKLYGTAIDSFYNLNQFNTIIAKVDTGYNQFAYIDMTQNNATAFMIPENLLFTNALVLEKDTAIFTNLKNNIHSVCNIAINVQVDANNVSINGYVNGTNYFAKQLQEQIPNVHLENVFSSFEKFSDNVKVTFTPTTGTVFEMNFNANNKKVAISNVIEVGCNYFPFFMIQPFVQNKRNANIDFGFSKKYIVNINLVFDNGLQIITYPKPYLLKTENDELALNINSHVDENQLQVSFEFDIAKAVLPKSEYDMVQQFFQILFDKINEPIVLQKK
jgi:hypothetical protein